MEPNSLLAEETALLELFIAGSKLGRALERQALYAELQSYDGLAVNYDYYIKVDELLEHLAPEEPEA